MFDLFNHHFFLRIGKRSNNTTFFSIIISLCVFLPLFILFMVLFVGAVQRTTPHINVQEMDAIKRPTIELNVQNYRMGLKFQMKNGSILDPQELQNYFELNVGYRLIKNNNSGFVIDEEKYFAFQPCERKDFFDFQEYYDKNLQKAICLTNHSVVLEGYWDESMLSFGYIDVKICNKSKNPLCKNKEEIAQVFRGGYLYLHTETQNVNSLNYAEPIILTMKATQFLIDTNVRNEVSFFFQRMEFETYDGIIFNGDARTWVFYKQTYSTQNSMSISEDETLIWSCFFLSSTKLLTIQRYYSTLIEIVGIIGGVSKFLILFGFIITAIYNDRILVWKLVAYLFEFSKSNKAKSAPLNPSFSSPKEGKMSLRKTESKKSIGKKLSFDISLNNSDKNVKESSANNEIRQSFANSPLNVSKITDAENIRDEKKNQSVDISASNGENSFQVFHTEKNKEKAKGILSKSNKNDSLNFSNLEFMAYVFLPRCFYPKALKKKVKLLQTGEENLQRYINVYQMITRFRELDNLKLLLLNPRQLALFNHISKPNIRANLSKSITNSVINLHISDSDILETLKGKQDGNPIDAKLLDLLNNEMKERVSKKFNENNCQK